MRALRTVFTAGPTSSDEEPSASRHRSLRTCAEFVWYQYRTANLYNISGPSSLPVAVHPTAGRAGLLSLYMYYD